jgi:hypothetical protein
MTMNYPHEHRNDLARTLMQLAFGLKVAVKVPVNQDWREVPFPDEELPR